MTRRRRPPWSLLRTRWLDVPIAEDVRSANLTWGAFSEVVGVCLQGVFQHVGRRVNGRASMERVVTEVLSRNLDVLVSPLEEQEKLRRLLAAADRLIARRPSAGPDETDGCERGDRGGGDLRSGG